MYAILLGNAVSRRRKTRRKQPHPLAHQIFESLYALPPRLELLRKLVKVTAPEQLAALDALLPEIKSRFKERSLVAHSVWALDHRAEVVVRIQGHEPSRDAYTVKDFEDMSNRIDRLLEKLWDLSEKMREPTRL